MELFRLFGTIGLNGVDETQRDIDETANRADDAESRMSSAFQRIGTAVMTYLAVDKIIDFGRSIVDASATVSAEVSAFEQIMGDYSDTAQQKLNEVADTTGVVSTRLTPYMTSMTAKFKGLGYDIDDATTLASEGLLLASDASAFWDKSLEDSMGALNSFINGSYEGGEAIGLFANDTQLASYAVQEGIVAESKEWANLDEARKQATRLQYAQDMFAMSGATGQASKEADQYANVQANLTEKWRQFKAQIGEPLLQNIVIPAMEGLSGLVDTLSAGYEGLNGFIEDNKTALELLGVVLGTLTALFVAYKIQINLGNIMLFAYTTATTLATTATTALSTAMAFLTSPIGIVIAVIGALVAVGVLLYNNWETVKTTAMSLWNTVMEVFGQIKDWIVEKFTEISTTITNVWNTITSACQTAWNTITSAISIAIQLIGQIISLAIDILLIPWNFIWNNFGTYLTQAWEFMKGIVTNALNAIGTFISTILTTIQNTFMTIWNAISGVISSVMSVIQNVITTVWGAISIAIQTVMNTIQTIITTVWNAISGAISSVMNAISSTISSIWNGISSTISGVVNGIKNTISSVFNSVKSTVTSVFNSIKSTATSVWNGVKSAIETPINKAKDLVKGAIDSIKGFFNFEFKWPKLKLPHFSVKPKGWSIGDLLKGKIPSLGIEWYAKGGIFDEPTIFQTPTGFKGVGEAGAEAVTPIDVLLDYVRTAVREENAKSDTRDVLERIIAILDRYLPMMSQMQIVLDSGTMVGEIAPLMDEELGRIKEWKEK